MPFFYVTHNREMLADRIFALVILIVATLLPIKVLEFVVIPEAQLILGTLVVLYILMRDPLAGLVMGLALLITYFRVFAAKYGFSWKHWMSKRKTDYPMASLVTDYITPDHLRSAQNNVVDERDYSIELKGINGVYGEEVYGAQGLDAKMPGFGEQPLGEDLGRKD